MSGGGVRGYISTLVLAELERRSGKRIHEMFDMVVGTSIGSFIGANIQGLPASYVSDLFKHLSPKVFKKNPLSFYGLFNSLYSTDAKNDCIKEVLDFKQECKIKYGYVAYDIKSRRPVIFNNVENINCPEYLITNKYSIADAVCASSSAPLYWDPYKLDNMLLVDGALISNSPVSIGVKLAQTEHIRLDDMFIVSIGTGKQTRSFNKSNGGQILGWLGPMIDILIDGQSELTNMCYEDEGLHYYNLDIDLLNANDDLDDISASNFIDLTVDAKRLIKLHNKKIDKICQSF